MPTIQNTAAIQNIATLPQPKAAPKAAEAPKQQTSSHGSDTLAITSQKKDNMAGLKAMAAEGAKDGLIYGSIAGAASGAGLAYLGGKIIEGIGNQTSTAFGVFGAKGVAIAAGGGLVVGAVMGTVGGTLHGGLAGAVTDINQSAAEAKGMTTEQASNRMKSIAQVGGAAYGAYKGFKVAKDVSNMISNPTAKAATAAAIVVGSAALSAWGAGATADYINNKVGR